MSSNLSICLCVHVIDILAFDTSIYIARIFYHAHELLRMHTISDLAHNYVGPRSGAIESSISMVVGRKLRSRAKDL